MKVRINLFNRGTKVVTFEGPLVFEGDSTAAKNGIFKHTIPVEHGIENLTGLRCQVEVLKDSTDAEPSVAANSGEIAVSL